ncbi:MAG: enoyl-CoA hydratase/isomerase family protein [Gammaproteobacteria bacterium]|nr:enoyl-CoA hydratase/isomerase family protein [Gammaproteobacteria bacterium]MCW5583714.1 enoyl-CoA hydratase/isomerase family protein [Gammaproteobacteria bacterium]
MMKNREDVLLIDKVFNDEIVILTFNRPQQSNTFNHSLIQALLEFWKYLYSDSFVKCVIVTGAGNKAFSAGADLKEKNGIDTEKWKELHSTLKQMITLMFDCPIPIIAAVNGVAYGGGLECILASDFAYASKNAIFAQIEIKRGIMPGAMGTQLLPRICGIKRSKELCFTGNSFTAEQALHYGIVNEVFTHENLMENVYVVAKSIAANAPLAIRAIKKSLNVSLSLDVKSGYEFEIRNYYGLLDSDDRKEGVKAFIEKRNPIFKGK